MLRLCSITLPAFLFIALFRQTMFSFWLHFVLYVCCYISSFCCPQLWLPDTCTIYCIRFHIAYNAVDFINYETLRSGISLGLSWPLCFLYTSLSSSLSFTLQPSLFIRPKGKRAMYSGFLGTCSMEIVDMLVEDIWCLFTAASYTMWTWIKFTFYHINITNPRMSCALYEVRSVYA